MIFPGGDGWLYAFEPKTGKLLWKFDCNPKKSDFKLGRPGDEELLRRHAGRLEGKVYIAIGQEPDDGTGEGHLWCIDITKTAEKQGQGPVAGQRQFRPQSARSTRTPASSGTSAAG